MRAIRARSFIHVTFSRMEICYDIFSLSNSFIPRYRDIVETIA